MAEGDVELGPVDTADTVQLLLKCNEEVQNPSHQRPASIFMVPSIYRKLSPDSYTPRVVSIGPLHHQDKHLIGFEAHKTTYVHNLLHNLLSRLNSTPEEIFKECLTKVSGSIDQIKACYIGTQAYPDSELVKMMVTDACFILAFLYEPYITYSSLVPIPLLRPHILLDMVLIENQIPFFVLKKIFKCTFRKLNPGLSLTKFMVLIQNVCTIFEGDLVMNNSSIYLTSDHEHILSFIHKSYQNPDLVSSKSVSMVKAHSAVELDRSGVRFSNKLESKRPMAMELELSRFLCFPLSWSKPTLKMPVLSIHDNSELILRNLIMYEYCSQAQACITSYMNAMDYLIDTPEDVAKLVKSQVLVNVIGSNEEAADIINKIGKQVFIPDFYYEDEWKKMDEYYNAFWPHYMADLRRKYFNNPWSIIALIAGIVLFVLTVVQTVYGVKAV